MLPQLNQNKDPGAEPFGIKPKDAERLKPRELVTVYYIGLNSLDRKDKNRPVSIFVPTIGRVINMPEIGESIDVPAVAIPELRLRTRWQDAAKHSHDGITDSPLIAHAVQEAVRRGDREIDLERAVAQANLTKVATDDLIQALLDRGDMPQSTMDALSRRLRQLRPEDAEVDPETAPETT